MQRTAQPQGRVSRPRPHDQAPPPARAPIGRIILILTVSLAFIIAAVTLAVSFAPRVKPVSPIYLGTSLYVATTDGEITALKTGDGTVRWTDSTGELNGITAVLSTERLLFYTQADGSVTALNSTDGSTRWHFTGPPNSTPLVPASPLLFNNGVLYYVVNVAGSRNSVVLAIDAYSGTLTWQEPIAGTGPYTVVILDSIIFVAETHAPATATTATLHVYAFTMPTGMLRWTKLEPGTATLSMVVGGDSVYIRTDHALAAYTIATSQQRWRVDDQNDLFLGAMSSNGALLFTLAKSPAKAYFIVAYAITNGNSQYYLGGTGVAGINNATRFVPIDTTHIGLISGATLSVFSAADGNPTWHRDDLLPSSGTNDPALTIGDSMVYATTRAGLVALRMADGQPLWTAQLGQMASASPPALMPGMIFVANNHQVLAFESATGSPLWRYTLPVNVSAPMQIGR